MFTAGHIEFRQSLLVRAADAQRLGRHRDLTDADRVGVLAGTTGEARLLELTGIAGANGVLAAGTRVETEAGTVVVDGSAEYFSTAAGAAPELEGRRHVRPVAATMPQVVYLADEAALVEALANGRIDAVGQGEAGSRAADGTHGGAFAVTALDAQTEAGGFALAAEDAELAACIDRHVAGRRAPAGTITGDRTTGRNGPGIVLQAALSGLGRTIRCLGVPPGGWRP